MESYTILQCSCAKIYYDEMALKEPNGKSSRNSKWNWIIILIFIHFRIGQKLFEKNFIILSVKKFFPCACICTCLNKHSLMYCYGVAAVYYILFRNWGNSLQNILIWFNDFENPLSNYKIVAISMLKLLYVKRDI